MYKLNPEFKKIFDKMQYNQNMPLSYSQYKNIGPIECMYKDSQGNDIYKLWEKYNKNIELPEPMKLYNP